MKTHKGNILSDVILDQADAICIPTNGIVKKNGSAVMGAGLAKQAKNKWPGIDVQLGHYLSNLGNMVCGLLKIPDKDCWVISFPTKNHWKDPADLELIKQSCEQLGVLADTFKWEYVFLPPVGCGLGGLSIDVVKPALEELLDDRFYLINFT